MTEVQESREKKEKVSEGEQAMGNRFLKQLQLLQKAAHGL